MSTIVTRAGKGSPLTHAEVDANFNNLNSDKFQEGNAIGSTTPAAGTFTTLTGTGQTNLGGSSSAPSFRATVGDNPPNTMWIEAKGAATADSALYLGVGGTPSKPLIIANSANPISFRTTTIGGTANEQFRVAHTASAVNYVQVTGATTTNLPTISAQGSDTNVALAYSAKGLASHRFQINGGEILRIGQFGTTTPVNRVEIFGGTSGFAGLVQPAGSDTNINMGFGTKATGSFIFETNTPSNGTGAQQFRITHTASAVNYVQVTGAATTASPAITAQGSDSTVALTLNTKSTGVLNLQVNSVTRARIGSDGSVDTGMASNGNPSFKALGVANQVNYVLAQGAAAGSSPEMSSRGNDTNIDLNLTTKGTGAVRFNTGGGEQFRVSNTASAVNFIAAAGAATGAQPSLAVAGTDANISFAYTAKGTGAHNFYSDAFGALQFAISRTASAVNYVQVTGSTTTNAPVVFAAGSDTNIPLNIDSKGTGNVAIRVGALSTVRAITAGASSDTFLDVKRQQAYVDLIAESFTATNADIRFVPKGTGLVRFGTRTATSDVAITGYLEIKDSGGTTRKLAIID